MLQLGFLSAIGLAFGLGITYFVLTGLYNIFFHPLRHYPGPLLCRASRLTWIYLLNRGSHYKAIHEMHEKYGPIVRIAPDELSFTSPEAFKDIYGHRVGLQSGLPELPKHVPFYRNDPRMPYSIINASRELHSSLRRGLAHGFSDKSMRAQESIIGSYVDLLIERLAQRAGEGRPPVNMVQWYNFTTFDVIGDLAMNRLFKCLETADYHPWVRLFDTSAREISVMASINYLGLGAVTRALAPYLGKSRAEHFKLTREALLQRMENKTERGDLIEGLLKREGVDYNFPEIFATSTTLLFAGSETTATLLSGVTYYLLKNPEALARVTEDVRSSFKSEDEITLISVQRLSYMLACLKEALRIFPPVVQGMPRCVPKGGCQIIGNAVPEGTVVAVPHYAIGHSTSNWKDPESFRPERFLGDAKYAGDKTDALQPFSYGPRDCIGRNLAYAEMRLILARILYRFDLKLDSESEDWIVDQKAYLLWKKPALQVYLTPAQPQVV